MGRSLQRPWVRWAPGQAERPLGPPGTWGRPRLGTPAPRCADRLPWTLLSLDPVFPLDGSLPACDGPSPFQGRPVLNSLLLRNALKIGIAAFLTAAIAIWCERITYVWYSLMAVVFVVDDNDAQTVQAASARLFGTMAGGLITVLVHTILSGWMGVMVSFLLILPVLRLAGWQSASGVATLVSLMFLMIPTHVELNWDYVFNRSLDTLLGSVVALAVGLLLWPRNQAVRLEEIPVEIRRQMAAQLWAYQRWLSGQVRRPEPLAPAQLTTQLVELETLLQQELHGPHGRRLQRQHWAQRQLLWHHLHHHWIQWERLLMLLPDSWMGDPAVALGADPGVDPRGPDPFATSFTTLAMALEGGLATRRNSGSDPVRVGPGRQGEPSEAEVWGRLAGQLGLPQLLMLAIGEELRPLLASLRSLNLIEARSAALERARPNSRRRQPPGPTAPC